jgi:hypothetical protein
MPPRHRSVSLVAVFAAILILLGFLVFLLTSDYLRRQMWVQGLVGIIITAVVAVILFTIVDSVIRIDNAPILGVIVSGGGAAIFYLVALPYIKQMIFPTHPVSGYVYYQKQNSLEPSEGVKGVVVEIPTTGQKSPETNDEGRFDIPAVYVGETQLKFHYAGKSYDSPISKDNNYYLIVRPPTEPRPQPKTLTQWKPSSKYKCEVDKNMSATAFNLDASVPKDAAEIQRGAKWLHLKVSLPQEFGDLTQPADTQPGNSNDFVDEGDVEGRTQGWEWQSINEDQPKINVSICVVRKPGQRKATASNLETIYWYGVLK